MQIREMCELQFRLQKIKMAARGQPEWKLRPQGRVKSVGRNLGMISMRGMRGRKRLSKRRFAC
jgi:hypothetical protein